MSEGERVKGTKLWQSPGSPIIQGRSRTQRPFWQAWAVGLAASCAAVALLGVVFAAEASTAGIVATGFASVLANVAAAFPGATFLSAIGTWFSRRIGTRQTWVVATAFGVVGGLASLWMLSETITVTGVVLK